MVPTVPKRSIFRDRALQKYIQGREKSVLPRIIAPPVFAFCWSLLVLLIVTGLVAWLGRIPLYISGSGVVLTKNMVLSHNSDEAMAVIMLPASEVGHIHVGFPVQVHIGQAGPDVTGSVDYVNPLILSPDEVRQRYGLNTADPALIIVTQLGSDVSRRLYAGSEVQVQVYIGSQRLLSLFPLVSDLLKDA
jgi:hypothetical protein